MSSERCLCVDLGVQHVGYDKWAIHLSEAIVYQGNQIHSVHLSSHWAVIQRSLQRQMNLEGQELSSYVSLRVSRSEKREEEEDKAKCWCCILPKEITTHYITKNNPSLSLFVSLGYIFSQSSSPLCLSSLPMSVPPQALLPSSLKYIISSNRSNMKSWDGEKREEKRQRRKSGTKGGKEETLQVIIRGNIILRLEVSWGHSVSLLKYKVGRISASGFMSLSLLIVRGKETY